MSRSSEAVAVLGSGIVGAAVVAAVLDSGRPVRVWGATESWYLSAFTGSGATAATTARSAVRGAGVVVLAPADDAESAATESHLGAALAGSTVIVVREPAGDVGRTVGWLSREGVEHLDCVVFGNVTRMGTPSSVVVAGGDPAVVERHRDLLDSLGLTVPLGGPASGARPTEVALVGFWYDVNVAVLRALATIDPAARPVLDLALRAVLAQLPAVVRSVDTGDPVGDDAGLAFHARALAAVIAARDPDGSGRGELALAAREVGDALTRDGPRAPLTRITRRLGPGGRAVARRAVG